MILLIDNYDSFTYNIVQYVGELGVSVNVKRNDEITLDDIKKMSPDKIIISPGPCTPNEAGISVDLIREFKKDYPRWKIKYSLEHSLKQMIDFELNKLVKN